MNQVEQIVEEILIENDLDWDHPVVDYLIEGVDEMLHELSIKTYQNYRMKARPSAEYHDKVADKHVAYGNPTNVYSQQQMDRIDKSRAKGFRSERKARNRWEGMDRAQGGIMRHWAKERAAKKS